MAPHSSTLAWKISWMEEPGGLQSMGVARSRTRLSDSLSLLTFKHWRRKWQPTPLFLPGESQGQWSLVGCRLQGCPESDMTEATQQQKQQQQQQMTQKHTTQHRRGKTISFRGIEKKFCPDIQGVCPGSSQLIYPLSRWSNLSIFHDCFSLYLIILSFLYPIKQILCMQRFCSTVFL